MSLTSRRSAPALAACIAFVSVSAALADIASQNLTPIYHAVDSTGQVVSSQHAERAFNPASVVKVATTLWALDRLGPGHRFETRFGIRGHRGTGGMVDGDLVVDGSGDPDFHVENAWLVAQALNAAGIREFTGSVVVDDDFWIGWEGGSEKREPDPALRTSAMADRLRNALDAGRRDADAQRSVAEFVARRGWAPGTVASVEFHGPAVSTGAAADAGIGTPAVAWVVTHRSNPVVRTLKRFNAFSNNDIERFEAALGHPAALEAWLAERLGPKAGVARLSSLSGLGVNRLEARGVVGLLQELAKTCAKHGLKLGDVLPVVGCDPGTLRNFPGLGASAFSGAVAAKTGSLDQTDGGVAVLAGIVATAAGERTFCIASTRVSGRLGAARAAQESWLLRLVADSGGPQSSKCPAGVPFSDEQAEVVAAGPGL